MSIFDMSTNLLRRCFWCRSLIWARWACWWQNQGPCTSLSRIFSTDPEVCRFCCCLSTLWRGLLMLHSPRDRWQWSRLSALNNPAWDLRWMLHKMSLAEEIRWRIIYEIFGCFDIENDFRAHNTFNTVPLCPPVSSHVSATETLHKHVKTQGGR